MLLIVAETLSRREMQHNYAQNRLPQTHALISQCWRTILDFTEAQCSTAQQVQHALAPPQYSTAQQGSAGHNMTAQHNVELTAHQDSKAKHSTELTA